MSKGPKQVTVPNIVGELKADANSAITDAGLTVGETSSIEDGAPKNTVLTQDPVADSQVDKGSAVDYTVSSGPPAVEIPPVKNQPAAEAQSTLEGLGLVVTVAERNHASVPAGEAVKTEPAAGEQVEVGTAVTLIVSKGPKQVTVPNIVGELKADANSAITDAGLTVGETSSIEDGAPKNTVLTQDPVADSQVDKGSAVDYTVSSGPPAVEIPPVKNQPAAEAQSTLEGLGLVVTVAERNHASVPAGEAVKTEPAAGEQVEVGTAVTLVVSKGPKQVTVPNIVGELRGRRQLRHHRRRPHRRRDEQHRGRCSQEHRPHTGSGR